MTAAVLLKDNGYSSVVFEEADSIGGHCHTLRFDPPPGESVDWLDVGVIEFPNTTKANQQGFGPWSFDSPSFFARFSGGPTSILTMPPIMSGVRIVDLQSGADLGMMPPLLETPTPEFFAALRNLQQIAARYPWLDTGQVPDIVPPELLVPFSDFITAHNLQPLEERIFSIMWIGGLGDFQDLTTLYAMINVGPTILSTLLNSPPFNLRGGCQTFYAGIQNYLGSNNVLVNAQVDSIVRGNGPIRVTGQIIDPSRQSRRTFSYTCSKIFIGFPPTLDKMATLFPDFDDSELDFYRKVRFRPFFATAVELSGPGVDYNNYALTNNTLTNNNSTISRFYNVKPERPYGHPELPATVIISRDVPYGPFSAPMVGLPCQPNTLDEMKAIVARQLAKLPSSVVTSANVPTIFEHRFQPYYSSRDLQAVPSPPSELRSLQGHRNTFYVGAIESFCSHIHIIERNINLIKANFPTRPVLKA